MPHTHDDIPERASSQAQGFLARCRAASAPAGMAVALLCLGSADAGAQTLRTAQAPAAAPLTSAVQAVAGQPPTAQPRVLTLDDALALAEKTSEQVTMAEAGVTRAESAERRVRSEWYPQVSALASYDRALASEFEGLFDAGGTPCTPFTVNPQAPLPDRVTEIERALRDCPPTGNLFSSEGDSGTDDVSLPFGRPNTYRLNLAVSQNVYTGGRLAAQQARARLGRTNAAIALTSTRAQLVLDVARAYFDAVLSDRLVAIAEAALAQAEQTAEQVRQQREAGRMAEFDLLRSQVARDNQRPEVIRRRNARDVAYLRLKQLLDIPLDTPVQLAVDLEQPVLGPPAERLASAIAAAESGTGDSGRTAVTQAENDVQQREADVKVARSQRLPSVSVSTTYGPVAYPSVFPGFGDFRTNWTVGASAQVPLFTGGRIKADEIAARADLTETQARLRLTRELATLDDASARLELANARAAWEATGGTVQQAVRAYEIAELRYREGLSTQVELADARLLLFQARASRAQAARDVQLARVRLAVLPQLPLDATGASSAVPTQPASAPAQQAAPAGAAGATAPRAGALPGGVQR